MAVVLDANIYVSAIISNHGPSAILLKAASDAQEDDAGDQAPILRDRSDDYLHLARQCGAEYVVSGDTDLTDERTLSPAAITPRQAVDRLGLA